MLSLGHANTKGLQETRAYNTSVQVPSHVQWPPATRFFELNTTNLRSHSLKLDKHNYWRTTLMANAFSISIINELNAIPKQVVTTPSILTFKSRYNKQMGVTQYQ